MWERVMKINLFMFVVSGAILTRKDIDLGHLDFGSCSWCSWGPRADFSRLPRWSLRSLGPGGFIGGNNEFALALVMTIPLMYYLWYHQINAG